MLADGMGAAALARFDRDLPATLGLGHVVIAVGNDLVFSFAPHDEETAGFLEMLPGAPVTADDVIAAHLQLAARTRAHGVKVYAATIAPYGGAEMYSPEGDSSREQVNSWIRTSGAFDGVLDFDAVWRDPPTPPASAATSKWATTSTATMQATRRSRKPSTSPPSTDP
jgi:hypothetical protein